MKALVTGASGLIGRALVTLLSKRGHDVTCLIRDENKRALFADMGLKFAIADITDRRALFRALEGLDVDVLFHFAALNPLYKDKKMQRSVNIDGMKNMIDASLRGRVGLFIYAQGMGVFESEVIDEYTPRKPYTEFAKIRQEAEEILMHANYEQGLNVAVGILGDVYGTQGWFADMIVERLLKGNFVIPGSGRYYRSFIHMDDAAEAFALLAEKNAQGAYIICDDEPVTFEEFVNYVADRLGVKKPTHAPEFFARLAVSGDLIKLLTHSTNASNIKIKRELGFTPKYPIYREGVNDILRRLNK